jgi:hypothetical protein
VAFQLRGDCGDLGNFQAKIAMKKPVFMEYFQALIALESIQL